MSASSNLDLASVNLEDMSYRDLKALQKRVNDAIVKRAEQEKLALRKNLKAMIEDAGFSFDEVLGQPLPAVSTKTKPLREKSEPVLYLHPDNSALSWHGRGKAPSWIRELESQGRSREDFLAKQPNGA